MNSKRQTKADKNAKTEQGDSKQAVIVNLIKAVKESADQPEYFIRKETGHWHVKLTTPFSHYWSFGLSIDTHIQNLTTPDEPLIAFGTGHFPVLYNYELNTMVTLKGHRNKVCSTSTDYTGQWLVTADSGLGSTVIVWNVQQCIPVYTIFEFEKRNGNKSVFMSHCAKYLAVHVNGPKRQEINIYEWAAATSSSKATLVLDPNFGEVIDVAFCEENSEYFMVTSRKHVLFVTYVPDTKEMLCFNTHGSNVNKGLFTRSVYHKGSHLCLSSTTLGKMAVWSDLDYFEGPEELEVSNEKDLILYLDLVKESINDVHSIDGYIAIGTDRGKVAFYDNIFRIIYWVQHKELGPIIQISFNRRLREDTLKDYHYQRRKVNTMFILGKLCIKKKRDVSKWQEIEKSFYENQIDFSIRDFVVKTSQGAVAYINFSKEKIEYLLDNFVNNVTAFDCHPEATYLAVGNEDHEVCLIDYKNNQAILIRKTLPIIPVKSHEDVYVSSMKYSPNSEKKYVY